MSEKLKARICNVVSDYANNTAGLQDTYNKFSAMCRAERVELRPAIINYFNAEMFKLWS